MNTFLIKDQAERVERARSMLSKATKDLETIRSHQGQVGYSVHVNGVSVAVSSMDDRTYMAKMIHGREMIHLGAIKAMQSIVDQWSDEVRKQSEALRSLVTEGEAA